MPFDFGGRGEMSCVSCLREIEGVAENSIHPDSSEDTLLHHQLFIRTGIKPAANLRVFPSLFSLTTINRCLPVHGREAEMSSREEFAPGADSQTGRMLRRMESTTPQRDVVGHPGNPDRTEKNSIGSLQLVQSVFGHHRPGGGIGLAAPIVVRSIRILCRTGCRWRPAPGSLRAPLLFRYRPREYTAIR